ncbi:Lcl domain-containing protein [Geotalea uraniireducens]|uniref:Lcl domain-containing protein n=1 Tax=Geotalea uraniireducens TaxID=351604 RepID=UPI00006AE281|nr:DUF1566 domain-containing protein [Geotalea uraniireducens]
MRQPFFYRQPRTPTPPRFTVSDGAVTDNLTGLIWLQNANCFGGQTWAAALASGNNLASGACGLTDGSTAGQWRLPTRLEMESLVDRSTYNPALPDNHPFINVQAFYYWSSSTYGYFYTDFAWGVNMYDGGVSNTLYKTNSNYFIWPVRGGQFGNSVISVLPASIAFGTSNQVVTISNTAPGGSSKLQINAIGLRGTNPSQFSINPGDGTGGTCGSTTPILTPGASCTVTVSFTPSSLGTKSATLRVSGSDVNAPNTDTPLSGTGFTVTGSVSGGNGSISSANPTYVANGATASFTLAPAATYQPSTTVSGTCPVGSFNGNSYTTGAITSDCTVGFSFVKNTYPLTITFTGTGGGTVAVQPNPPATDCTGTCSQSIRIGTAVTLAPAANNGSSFTGWSGACTGTGVCQVTMDTAKSATATFTYAPAKVADNFYTTVGAALLSDVLDGGTLQLQSMDLTETIVFNRSVSFSLQGGYDPLFTSINNATVIHGSIAISAGTVNIDNIVIM